jgi:hypothetical protein
MEGRLIRADSRPAENMTFSRPLYATKETSGYGTLAKLLDAVGHSLKPKVHCLIQLKPRVDM